MVAKARIHVDQWTLSALESRAKTDGSSVAAALRGLVFHDWHAPCSFLKKEKREEREEKEKREEIREDIVLPSVILTPKGAGKRREAKPRPTRDTKVADVWDYFTAAMKHYKPTRRPTKPTEKDKRMVLDNLALGFTVEDLCRAVYGLFNEPFYLGANDRDTEYLELRYAMKNPQSHIVFAPSRLEPWKQPKAASLPEQATLPQVAAETPACVPPRVATVQALDSRPPLTPEELAETRRLLALKGVTLEELIGPES